MKNSENNIMLSVGDIVVDNKLNKKYRVVAIVNDEVTLCEMETTKFSLSLLNIFSMYKDDKSFTTKHSSFFSIFKFLL